MHVSSIVQLCCRQQNGCLLTRTICWRSVVTNGCHAVSTIHTAFLSSEYTSRHLAVNSVHIDRGVRQTVVEKTAQFYHQCQQLFKQYYSPGRDFALDETMIRFQGRSSWITIIKGKPVPVGYKLYTVASAGYLLEFRIFRGKGGYNSPQNVLYNTVMDLVDPWKDVHRRLYFDNLYTSPALCDALLQKRIQSCGTCRTNRRALPPTLKQETGGLDKGEHKAWQRGHLGCLLWNDVRPVVFLSTHRRIDSFTAIPAAGGRPSINSPERRGGLQLQQGPR